MEAQHSQTIADIRSFLERERWLRTSVEVEFLAAGEYNENYLISTPDEKFVFRINHGTQLGLNDQISYEFEVLKAVHPSGVTPRPVRLCPTDALFPLGVMLMEYLPGVAFSYQRDWPDAAELFAKVHRVTAPDSLVTQPHPVAAIVTESVGLLARHRPHPLAEVGARIEEYALTVQELGAHTDPDLAAEPQCIVNSEVNSGNFIAPLPGTGNGLKLVDWEKAVVSSRCQDLAHFLVPTTTLWKSDFTFSPDTRKRFLERYHRAAGLQQDPRELDRRTGVMERAIVLRALSWCYMAYAEYTVTGRTLRNDDTFRKITFYLENAESFMDG